MRIHVLRTAYKIKSAPMKTSVFLYLLIFIFFSFSFPAISQTSVTIPIDSSSIEQGVSEKLAISRKLVLNDLEYTLSFIIPLKKAEPILAKETIHFTWSKNSNPLLLDFKVAGDHIKHIAINNAPIDPGIKNEHLVIPDHFRQNGKNVISIDFIAGDQSLNRNDDYLYTLLVPDRARTLFPCFDQPDLKATFQLSLTFPKEWKAVSNAALHDSLINDSTKIFHFDRSDKISTYLFSFAVGKFDVITQRGNGTMHFFHRETDSSKLNLSIKPVFKIHQDALTFLETYSGIPFPFKKFDFTAIPDFQYGGMEHVGAIDYKASSLFLDKAATKDEEINRSSLLAHETAHMWFGDLVTMKWFNDVWEKEVFANFMADKITKVAMPEINFALKFLLDHFPAAYAIDRTGAPNPIRQRLDNLQDAGSLYGNIIYHKAPVMMRQLERRMGKQPFRNGLKEYLKTYAFGNATWPDLINILSKYTSRDLVNWNNVWVNGTGRPIINFQLNSAKGNIKSLVISQSAEDGSTKIWPQIFEMALVYPDHTEELTVNMSDQKVSLKEAVGRKVPVYILFNSSGQGYGVFPIDSNLVKHLEEVRNPVWRASVYINVYENMLNGKLKPEELLSHLSSRLVAEKEELNLRLITGQLSEIFWHFLLPVQRVKLSDGLENALWLAIQQQRGQGARKQLFRTYQSVALSKTAVGRLYDIWKNQIPPKSIILNEDDYTSLALSLALRDTADTGMLDAQLKRIHNPDRQKRLKFIMPALSPSVIVRDSFFSALRFRKNREKESWVTAALQYLHHPIHATDSEKYLKTSLELLQEIQLTGDIFFPQAWLQASFGMYQTSTAEEVVRVFLRDNPSYNPMLRAKIIQAADGLFRARKMLY